MIFHENRLLADDSQEKAYLIYFEIGKDVAKFVVLAIKGWEKGRYWQESLLVSVLSL